MKESNYIHYPYMENVFSNVQTLINKQKWDVAIELLNKELENNNPSASNELLINHVLIKEKLADIYNTIGSEQAQKHNIENPLSLAIMHTNEGIELLKDTVNQEFLLARLFTARGIANWFSIGPDLAIEDFKNAYKKLSEIDKEFLPERSNALKNIALCNHTLGNLSTAIKEFRLAINLNKNATTEENFNLNIQLANALGDDGQLEAAAKTLEEIKPKNDSSEDTRLRWLNAKAIVSWQLGDYKDADKNYDEIHDIYASANVPNINRAAALTYAATFKIESGWFAQAKTILELADTLNKKNAPFSFRMNHLKARIKFAIVVDDKKLALKSYNEACDLINSRMSDNQEQWIDLALLALQSEKDSEIFSIALDQLREKLLLGSIDNPFEDFRGEKYKGVITWLYHAIPNSTSEQDLSLLKLSIQASMLRGSNEYSWRLWAALSQILRNSKRNSQAIIAGKMAVREILFFVEPLGIKNPMGEAFLVDKKECINNLMKGLMLEGRFLEWQKLNNIITDTEIGKNLRTGRFDSTILSDQFFVEQERSTVAEYLKQQKECSKQFNETAFPLEKNSKEHFSNFLKTGKKLFDTLVISPDQGSSLENQQNKKLEWSGIKHNYPSIAFIEDEDCINIFFKSADDEIHLKTKGHSTRVAQIIHDLHQKVVGESSFWKDDAQKLYDILINPVENYLSNCSGIKIIAEGILSLLPFEVLFDGHKTLIEKFEISYSSTRKKLSIEFQETRNDILLCGYNGSVAEKDHLPYVEYEFAELKKIFNSPYELVGKSFTKENLQQELKKLPDIVHFSTHLEFIPGSPQRSYILLGEGEHLSIHELLSKNNNWKNISLVFFAACNSALNENKQKVSDVSISDLFFEAGVNSFIGAGWPVSDETAARTSKLFYKHLNNYPASAALRLSQLELLKTKKFKSPIHWAAFKYCVR